LLIIIILPSKILDFLSCVPTVETWGVVNSGKIHAGTVLIESVGVANIATHLEIGIGRESGCGADCVGAHP